MARARKRTPNPTPQPSAAPAVGDTVPGRQFTGKYLVLLPEDDLDRGLKALKNVAGLQKVVNAADFAGGAVEAADADAAEVLVLDKLNVAVVNADPTQFGELAAAASGDSAILAVEPEQIMYALDETGQISLEYLRGFKDAATYLYEQHARPARSAGEVEAAGFVDDANFTWGLIAARVSQSRFGGRGVRVAVLDTGFDLDHPDFVGRTIQRQSFVQGQAVNDLNGHGTHCIGTALGAQRPAGGVRRYGCAFQAEIFAGKVLSNQGSGGDTGILNGINWAITNRCRIISMSLGAPVAPGESFSTIYENVAQRALRSNPGTLIVAAAGNDSRIPNTQTRREPPNPVGRPANCPSILAVAALDADLRVAAFSNGGINPNGGGVDIAGPGVGIFSSVPTPFPATVQPVGVGRPWPPRYHTISGTSMATPHVAGIAALWLEARGVATPAQALWQLLTGNARRLNLPSRDVGAGLVQAPV